MKKNEACYLASFLEHLDERFGNDGCNDLPLANTSENRAMVRQANLRAGWEPAKPTPRDGKIWTNNSIILGYLLDLFMRQEGVTEEDVEAHPAVW